ncbi:hypothetical protein NP603_18665 [Methylomonas sp. SURF-1]|uniref:Uncharacterized protein n=1 Tax=Methylomonas aurea TaxID=2952224 RepID=A0ABT1ULN4_9GAMM|nr:hypothetical protein [Methylomonas sp. SURF-1]MCQ8183144.1 hypothetical protein [Methylomonas sp. SURF-1]
MNNDRKLLSNFFLRWNPITLLNNARKDYLAAWRNYSAIFGNRVIVVGLGAMFALIVLCVDLNDYLFNPPLTLEQMNKDTGRVIGVDSIRKQPAYSILLDVDGRQERFRVNFGDSRVKKSNKDDLFWLAGKNITILSQRKFDIFFWNSHVYEIFLDGKPLFNDYAEIYQRRVSSRNNSKISIPIEMLIGFGPLMYVWFTYRNKK